MPGFKIRPAKAKDAKALTAVLKAAYAPYAGLNGLPDVTFGIADNIKSDQVWVTVIGGRLLGGVVLSAEAAGAHLINLGVHPDGAGRRLGTWLVTTAEAQARRAGARRMSLGTHLYMHATRRFYHRLGYAEIAQDGLKVSLERTL